MPNTSTIGSIISGVGSLASGVINAISSKSNNKSQQQFAQNMYNQQRADALSDWNMQNAYNAPAQQMARYKAAGLNPNLIYGQGNSGNSTPVRTSSPSTYPRTAVQVPDLGSIAHDAIMTKYQVDQANLQNRLTQAQIDKTEQDRALSASQTNMNLTNTNWVDRLNTANLANTQSRTQNTDFQTYSSSQMLPLDINRAQLSMAQMQQSMDVQLKELANDTAKMNMGFKDTVSQMALRAAQMGIIPFTVEQMKSQMASAAVQRQLDQWNLDFSKSLPPGVRPSDPLWQRQLSDMSRAFFQNLSNIWH